MKKFAVDFIIIGVVLFIVGFVSLELSPDSIYATGAYGTGIVRYHNNFGHASCSIGALVALLGWYSKKA